MKSSTTLRNVLKRAIEKTSTLLPFWKDDNYIEEAGTSYSHTYELPLNFIDLPPVFAEQYERQVFIKNHKIYCLKNVYVTWHGMVFKNLRIFIPSLISVAVLRYFQDPLLLKQWLSRVTRIEEEEGVAIAYNHYAPTNYYHWIIDTLPRLVILRKRFPTIRLIIPAKPADFILQSTLLLGFDRFIEVENGQVFKIKKLFLPDEHAAPVGHNDPSLIRIVRNELLAGLGTPVAVPHKRLYISRERQKARRVSNQQELTVLLAKYNFETVYFEGLPMREQVKIMQEATLVVSGHGANLVNILFCNPSTPLIELQSITLSNPEYWRLCSALDLPYYVLACEAVEDEPISHHSNSDVIVDLTRLEDLLIRILT